jgi:DNA polymerase III delta subunit
MVEGGLSLFTGPDRYRKRERVKALEQASGCHPLDRHELSGAQLSAAALATLIRERPAASPLRLIVIDEADRLDASCLALLEEHAAAMKQTACLILLAHRESRADDPLSRLAAQASIERFEWLPPHEVRRWITQYVATQHKRIEEAAIRDLLGVFGSDLAGIRSTLDQLVSWVGSRPQVSQGDLRVFLRSPSTTDDFALADAIADRDRAAALRALHEQLAAGGEELKLLGLLVWQLQRWLTVRHLMDGGASRERIAEVTRSQPWQVERMGRALAGRTADSLRQALRRCWRLDAAAKSGQVPILSVALEQLVVELCLPASGQLAGRPSRSSDVSGFW